MMRVLPPSEALRLLDKAGDYGWGRTEAEAVADFVENCAEAHDERLGVSREARR